MSCTCGLDFDEGTTLVSLSQDIPSENSRGNSIPILDLLDWREQQTAFRGLAPASRASRWATWRVLGVDLLEWRDFSARARGDAAGIDPWLPLSWTRTMEESIATGTWIFTIFGSLFSIFAAAALFLTACGRPVRR